MSLPAGVARAWGLGLLGAVLVAVAAWYAFSGSDSGRGTGSGPETAGSAAPGAPSPGAGGSAAGVATTPGSADSAATGAHSPLEGAGLAGPGGPAGAPGMPGAADAAQAPGESTTGDVAGASAQEIARDRMVIRHALPANAVAPQDELTEAALIAALGQLVEPSRLRTFFHLENFVLRAVATVDDLPRERVAMQVRVFKGTPGQVAVIGAESELVLNTANYARYTPILSVFESLDIKQATRVFMRFYPLFQREFRQLGYPNRYFNDRLIAALDDLLLAPTPSGPIRLIQPKVMYQFADPQLESLSAGQKLMIRMGPENAERVKAKLRLIRRELAAHGSTVRAGSAAGSVAGSVPGKPSAAGASPGGLPGPRPR